ncbi:MAG: hypothetical protein HQL36_12910 [Alphaproteobacteria bacterium]|nr:hypothetical protein [Alphaproteobacteria bacterium]MBF0249763.1 hypothetical protein [Alphaproteobacteria bacterium]
MVHATRVYALAGFRSARKLRSVSRQSYLLAAEIASVGKDVSTAGRHLSAARKTLRHACCIYDELQSKIADTRELLDQVLAVLERGNLAEMKALVLEASDGETSLSHDTALN